MKVAVVLNGNARSINTGAINKIHRACGKRIAENKPGEYHVFVSKSLEDAKRIASLVVKENFDIVMSGGGDGTFAQCVTDMLELTDTPPAFGMLKMGTGNALADILGITSDIDAELDCAQIEDARTSFHLIKTNGIVAPFAGFGLDAMVLNDYDEIKNELDDDPIFGTIRAKRGALDYGFAITLRSIWKLIVNAPITNIKVYCDGGHAAEIDEHGMSVYEYENGDLIYNGSALMVGASTIPYYGMGFKMFPQANPSLPGFQLRVINIKPHELITNLPAFLTSDLSHEHITDFRCIGDITIEAESSVPAQIGGNFIGQIEEMAVQDVEIDAVLGSASVKNLSKYKDNYRF